MTTATTIIIGIIFNAENGSITFLAVFAPYIILTTTIIIADITFNAATGSMKPFLWINLDQDQSTSTTVLEWGLLCTEVVTWSWSFFY